jgi:aspartyl-tRNA(Asn)/glutamyl-tRNA(Gln) amidotransferase subunit C
MTIPKESVEHVAKLARLELTSDEVERYTEELSKIIGLVDELNELDLSQEELGVALDEPTVFREDQAIQWKDNDALFKNAPLAEDGFYRVPKILDDSGA